MGLDDEVIMGDLTTDVLLPTPMGE